jgi:hypothetical protein
MAAWHKLSQGNRVCSLHELSKNVHVGQTKAFPNFLCIWIDKEQVVFILYLPKLQPQQSFSTYHTPFHAPTITSS